MTRGVTDVTVFFFDSILLQHARSTTPYRPRTALPASSGLRQTTTRPPPRPHTASVRVVCGSGEKKGGKGGGERKGGGGGRRPAGSKKLETGAVGCGGVVGVSVGRLVWSSVGGGGGGARTRRSKIIEHSVVGATPVGFSTPGPQSMFFSAFLTYRNFRRTVTKRQYRKVKLRSFGNYKFVSTGRPGDRPWVAVRKTTTGAFS